jgi:hypothetical protein
MSYFACILYGSTSLVCRFTGNRVASGWEFLMARRYSLIPLTNEKMVISTEF